MFPRIRMKKTQDNKDIYKIKKVTIKGYKSIDFDVPLVLEFGDVNILLGANGAGKSNIVSFFRMLGFMMSGSLQRFVEQQGTNQVFLHYGSKKTPLLSGELHLENFYTSFVIYSKSALYKIHIAFKEQIRNKTVFFYNSVFFSFHLISFFALGNI